MLKQLLTNLISNPNLKVKILWPKMDKIKTAPYLDICDTTHLYKVLWGDLVLMSKLNCKGAKQERW